MADDTIAAPTPEPAISLPPLLFWRATQPAHWSWADPSWSRLTGQATSAALDLGWLDRVHPADRATTLHAWDGAAAAGRFAGEHRLLDSRDDGRWFRYEAAPVRDSDGRIVEWLGASSALGEIRALVETERALPGETQRRLRNMLAVVRSISGRTAETSGTVEEFLAHFEGRLTALARTHLMLTQAPEAGLDLQNLLREEILAQAGPELRVEIAGPDIYLFGRTAEVVSQALHELATNAVKYGAFSTREGRLAVRWRVTGEGPAVRLRLEWRESGVQLLAKAPRRQGFGTKLVQQRLAYEIGGAGEIVFKPGGVTCVMEVPLGPGRGVAAEAPADGAGLGGMT